MNNISGIVRLILIFALLYWTYTDIGGWTALTFALMLAGVELFAFKKRNKLKG